MTKPSGNPRKPPPNPWKRIEELQATNDALGENNRTLNTTVDTQRSTIAQYLKALDVADARIGLQSLYINALCAWNNALSRPWWKRSSSEIASARFDASAAIDSIYRFDADPTPFLPDAPGAIMGLSSRQQVSNNAYNPTPLQDKAAAQVKGPLY